MQVEVNIDETYTRPKAVILTAALTDEVRQAVEFLSHADAPPITGYQGGTVRLLDPAELIRVYASAGKVLAATERGEYTLRLRLYEAEARLDKTVFVRISHSEIINLRKAKAFDLRLSGTISVQLADGSVSYVSRRYVARIKQLLGV